MEELVSVSYLPTKQDYMNYCVAVCTAAARAWEKIVLHGVGLALAAGVAVLWVLDDKTPINSVWYSVLMLGALFIAFFQEMVQPLFVRLRAQEYFDSHQKQMISQTFTFYESELHISTDRCSTRIPYEFLYKVYETQAVLLLYTAANEIQFIPKRALDTQECELICRILKEKLGENYQQEGAR